MRIDPRLIERAARQALARKEYDEHIRNQMHPVQWPMLSTQKQKEWYARYDL